ncbi:hypothetical protein Q2T41_07020 [Maribacter confluentis]|uniref:Uncharacterized protein n=1 Tax=Maribacter confluentis TaxID=1656093 RepID=A0ABT8RQK9_9FLAO|nr:hypothetical protein [Maribacter confluentis]MDO1512401.1 hypothetical protein [Maribacter confluentis]
MKTYSISGFGAGTRVFEHYPLTQELISVNCTKPKIQLRSNKSKYIVWFSNCQGMAIYSVFLTKPIST